MCKLPVYQLTSALLYPSLDDQHGEHRDKYTHHVHHRHLCHLSWQCRKMNIICMMCIEKSASNQIMPSSNYLSSQTKWSNVLEYASHSVCFTETTTVNKVCPIITQTLFVEHTVQDLANSCHQPVVNFLSILSDKYKHNAQIGKTGHC